MDKRVILITGSPAVGKTTLSKRLAEQLNLKYINLTELTKKENLALSEDTERETIIIDETKMRRKLKSIINQTQTDIVIDGHYAAAVTPKSLVTFVFVLRRSPVELRELMIKRGYNQAKQDENLASEILDVCLVEALQKQEKHKICEIDLTDKPLDTALTEILGILQKKKDCRIMGVDWLGKLEREGKLYDYLKI